MGGERERERERERQRERQRQTQTETKETYRLVSWRRQTVAYSIQESLYAGL